MSDIPFSSDSLSDTTVSRCAACNAALGAGSSYIVRIDIFADPTWSDSGLTDKDAASPETLAQIITQIKSMSVDALQDSVHRRFEYHICRNCQPKLLANPLGLPRITRDASN